eukprot:Tbor_TRINITY_DN2405_c0_g1::TRINITY_DN2405_c0_g1_i1::g.2667::m.2667
MYALSMNRLLSTSRSTVTAVVANVIQYRTLVVSSPAQQALATSVERLKGIESIKAALYDDVQRLENIKKKRDIMREQSRQLAADVILSSSTSSSGLQSDEEFDAAESTASAAAMLLNRGSIASPNDLSDEENGITDPSKGWKQHKSRVLSNPAAIKNMVECGAKRGVSLSNHIIVIGRVVGDVEVGGWRGSGRDAADAGSIEIPKNINNNRKGVIGGVPVVSLQGTDSKKKLDPIQSNTISNSQVSSDSSVTSSPTPYPGMGSKVLRFRIRQTQYRTQGYPSSPRAALNFFEVHWRYQQPTSIISNIPPPPVKEGDILVVSGHYGVHAVFQLDSNAWQMNPVVDVGPAGYVGWIS